jgi:serine/threonine protein kinase/tetratricopeptide (TPR) repeat protein
MIGRTISHYRILDKLGEGGMGIVYRAQDTRLDRLVALKFLPLEEEDGPSRERFLREARAAAHVHHPYICPIYQVGEVDGQLFIAMALVEGTTLRDTVKRGPFPISEAIDLALQVASGLQVAHEQGVVHRDIKSSNIVMDRQGNACILDFGLALRSTEERVTVPGSSIGTPAYMSPEQAMGDTVDARTDLWALGVVLFEMLTGRLPFQGERDLGVMYSIVNKEPARATSLRADIPDGLQDILDRALAKDPRHRYQTAAEMSAALRAVREGASARTRTIALPPLKRPRSYLNRRTLLIAAPFLIGAAALFAWRMMESRVKNVAVIPLEVIGGDEPTRVLADGLVESLTSQLTQLERFQGKLMVIPASEIRSRHVTSAADAARSYGANLVITGSAQHLGDRVQFTLNLVDTRSLRQIASRSIDYDAANPIALRNEAIQKAVDILAISVAPEASKALKAGETASSAAYAQFLVGSGYLARYDVRGNLPRAIESLRKAVELDPQYSVAWAALARAYQRGQADDPSYISLALAAVQRAIDLSPDLVSAYITRVDLRISQKQVDAAIADATHARRLAPNDGEACYALGNAYEAAGRVKEAEQAFAEAVKRRPSDWYTYVLLGAFYIRQSKFHEARNALEAARKITPDNAVVNRNLAVVNMREGRYADAESQLRRALTFDPSARSYNALGLAYYYQHQYADAAASLRKGLDLAPNIYQLWGNLGTVIRRVPGQKPDEAFSKAIALATIALHAAPGDSNIHANLAEYYAKLSQCPAALEQIHQISTDLRAPYMTRIALAYELCGDRANAIETVGSLLQNPTSLNEIRNDPDLQNLWQDARFQAVVQAHSYPGL